MKERDITRKNRKEYDQQEIIYYKRILFRVFFFLQEKTKGIKLVVF
ncbi:hypothetical protein Tsubulata_008925, partial [Turnera subulata]